MLIMNWLVNDQGKLSIHWRESLEPAENLSAALFQPEERPAEREFAPLRYLKRGEGECIRVFGEQTTLLATGSQNGGVYALAEIVSAPRNGPPLCVHHREDQTFYIVEGEYCFHIGDRVIHAGEGDYLHAPRDTAHTYVNARNRPSRMLVTLMPGGCEAFWREVEQMASGRLPDTDSLLSLARKYDLEFLPQAT
jgi:mannose-6-phosphate isomerase-like protein (cupin superfamily)